LIASALGYSSQESFQCFFDSGDESLRGFEGKQVHTIKRKWKEVSGMVRTRSICLVILAVSLLLTACGPSQEQIRARDNARSAALAAEARVVSLQNEYEQLNQQIPQLEQQIPQLEQEKAELQAEYESLGGTGR